MPSPQGWTITVDGGVAAYPPSYVQILANGTLTLFETEEKATIVAGPFVWGHWTNLKPTNLPEQGGA